MFGLNIEYDRTWLERHDIRERDLGGYRLLDSVWSQLAVMQLVTEAFEVGPKSAVDAETKALELLDPLVTTALGREQLSCPAWLRRTREILHDSFRSSLRVHTIAREVGVHPVHLTRVFRRHHGCGVTEYLCALRMAEAGRLILRQGHTIAEAAHEAGFADQAHLCRCFSTQLGFSPKRFRDAAKMPSDVTCNARGSPIKCDSGKAIS
jgi:AraC family transcriptional regulator